MCQPSTSRPQNILICGAGPAGLLAAILLLRRNNGGDGAPKYRVTLVDPGADYGALDESGLNRARSWMIGLSCHGLSAIRSVPNLYEDYVRGLGVDIARAVFGITKRVKFTLDAKDFIPDDNSFTVDRNYICAALSRYLNDNFGEDDENFACHYHTRALYVDGDNKCVIARRHKQGFEECEDVKFEYDVVLGCDGIRSVVRNAFLTRHRDFEFELRGTFGVSKSIHVPLPDNVEEGTFMFINECLPGCRSFILPETGRKLNVGVGHTINKECPPELQSKDPAVVAAYFKKHWHAFDIDADEAGRQWVDQTWNTISQVHVNFYHSEPLRALLLGDAAHATSPQIGQGMNTALADAAALDGMLDEHKDDWTKVLPQFSKERVKEGNALTDLSFYTFSLSPRQQVALMTRQSVRRTLNRLLPWLIEPDPMTEVSRGMKLSEAYHLMSKYGVIRKVRAVNDDIMRDHFEKTNGMVREEISGSVAKKMVLFCLPVVVGYAVASSYLSG